MIKADEILKLVNKYLDNLSYDRKPSSLYEPIRYVLSMGGKRIRPVLMLLSYNMFRENPEEILMPACALETYHNYTLLHDDLMDNADLRRGHETVHRKWDANTAILSGDSMLVLAYQRMAQCDKQKMPEVLSLFTETALEIGEGQQYDMDFEVRNNVTLEEYIDMIRLKTSVLIGCACKMGALIAGASEANAQALYETGLYLGLAFQLQDDVLDVWGDEATFGKAIGGDIMNNKKTFLLIGAMQKAQGDDANELRRWINNDYALRSEKVPAVTALYERLGMREAADEAIKRYDDMAFDALSRVEMSEEAREAFVQLIKGLVGRKK